jgi:uncharacterized phage-like protein YoqJ
MIPSAHMIPLYEALDENLLSLFEKGVRTFRAGGAMGFDTLAALRVLRLKACGYDVHLELILPCRDQTAHWPRAAVRDYDFISRHADSVSYVSESYTPSCMHDRNRALVDGSEYCIAYCTANRGGTAYTVAYALKSKVSLINLGELFL